MSLGRNFKFETGRKLVKLLQSLLHFLSKGDSFAIFRHFTERQRQIYNSLKHWDQGKITPPHDHSRNRIKTTRFNSSVINQVHNIFS